jgi:hypothetical protein
MRLSGDTDDCAVGLYPVTVGSSTPLGRCSTPGFELRECFGSPLLVGRPSRHGLARSWSQIIKIHGGTVPSPAIEAIPLRILASAPTQLQTWRSALFTCHIARRPRAAWDDCRDIQTVTVGFLRRASRRTHCDGAARYAGVTGFGLITCRFTHVYPDGPVLYYGVCAGSLKSLPQQWDEIKRALSDVLSKAPR